LKNYLEKLGEELEEDDIVMYFTSNHDENTWNGTVFERMGDASEMMAVVSYILPGMPLIYSGQEWDLDKRLNFFEKDTIPVGQNANFHQLYKKLGKLKNEYPALNGGKKAAGYRLLPTSMEECILAMMREKDGRR